jgi:hypothetical protein
MTGSIDRTPCPQCGLINKLYINIEFVVAHIGDFSLAGMQVKFPGRERPVLKCKNCPFTLAGEFDGEGYATFTPAAPKAEGENA